MLVCRIPSHGRDEVMEEILKDLIELVKSLTPEVWEVYMRQAYAIGITNLAWSCFTGVLAIICTVAARKTHKDMSEQCIQACPDAGLVVRMVGSGVAIDEFVIFFYVCGIVAGTMAMFLLLEGIIRFANPAYYAIQLLIEPLGGG